MHVTSLHCSSLVAQRSIMSADTKLILSLVNRIAVRVSRDNNAFEYKANGTNTLVLPTASLQQWTTHRLLGERSTHSTNVNAVIDISSRVLISLLISFYCYGRSHVLVVVGITSSSQITLNCFCSRYCD